MQTKGNTSISIFTAVLIVLVLTMTSCSYPGEANNYGQWDEDGDESLDHDEFANAFAETGFYDNWDRSNDRFLDESEWNVGWGVYHSEYNEDVYGTFDDWDTNADGQLDEEEFQKGIFDVFDKDGDNFVSENEYYTWYEEING